MAGCPTGEVRWSFSIEPLQGWALGTMHIGAADPRVANDFWSTRVSGIHALGEDTTGRCVCDCAKISSALRRQQSTPMRNWKGWVLDNLQRRIPAKVRQDSQGSLQARPLVRGHEAKPDAARLLSRNGRRVRWGYTNAPFQRAPCQLLR